MPASIAHEPFELALNINYTAKLMWFENTVKNSKILLNKCYYSYI